MWILLMIFVGELRSRWKALTDDPEAGYASETVLVTALLIIGALLVIGLIVAKVTAKANEIDLGWTILSEAR